MKKREVSYCLTCPLFEGYGARGQVSSMVICRLTKPDLLMIQMGQKYPDNCPLPISLVREGGADD